MKKQCLKRYAFRLALVTVLALPELLSAQVFNYNRSGGDLCAGFRKTGQHADPYEVVADLGNFTNFLNLSPGTTMTITNVSPSQLKDAFADGNSNLQWSVWGSVGSGGLPSPYGTFPRFTLWCTVPDGTNVNTQSVAPIRESINSQGSTESAISGCEGGAYQISTFLVNSNADNTPYLVREPVATYPNYILSTYISDAVNTAVGDFGSGQGGFPFDIENVTPNIFNAAQRSDLYLMCPASQPPRNIFTDPLTGQTNGPADYMGYFIFNPNGTLTFTRATTTVSAPAAGFTGSPTNGTAPLQVTFTDASTGTITNWLWNLGDGHSVTNTSNVSVVHSYTNAGSYTVSLTVSGPGGNNTLTQTGYIIVSSGVVTVPKFNLDVLSGGMLVISGTNGTASAQYRILMSTNLASGTWTPVFTNQFTAGGTFGYTNSLSGGAGAFFKLVSP